MKVRVKHPLAHSTANRNPKSLFSRLQSLRILTKQPYPTIQPEFASDFTEKTLIEEREAEMEVERAGATARAYMNMLPPR